MQKRYGLFKILGACVIAGALLASTPARASDVDRLLDLLVKKHVLTEEDAATFREEAKKEQSSKSDPPVAESPQTTAAKVTPTESAQRTELRETPKSKKEESSVAASSPIRLSGWVQARFTSGASGLYAADTFEARKTRLVVDGSLAPKVSYRIKIDVGRSPAYSRLWNALPDDEQPSATPDQRSLRCLSCSMIGRRSHCPHG